jgi:hypothetical protein
MQDKQVWLTSLHKDEATAEWYCVLEREYDLLPWARFIEFVNIRFGLPLHYNHLDELKELHHVGLVEDYQ